MQDLADSKRINSHVHGVSNDSTPLKPRRQLADIQGLTATIVSALFWPQLPQEDLKLPPEVGGVAGPGQAGQPDWAKTRPALLIGVGGPTGLMCSSLPRRRGLCVAWMPSSSGGVLSADPC